MTADLTRLPDARKEFLAFLKFTKGHRDTTCYNYSSDLNIWERWLIEAGLDWREVKPVDLERFVATLSRNGTGPHAVARKISSLATFYKWARRQGLVPVPDSFARVLGIALAGKPASEYVFAKSPGGKPMTARAVRDYLGKQVEKAGIEKPITPHKLRHTYATRLLENNAQLIDIQALLGHESIATTQIYTHAGQERLSKVVEGI